MTIVKVGEGTYINVNRMTYVSSRNAAANSLSISPLEPVKWERHSAKSH